MNVDAILSDADGQSWPILMLAMYTELGRFPRLHVQIESHALPQPGPYTLMLAHARTDTSALAVLSRTTWHVGARNFDPSSGRCWMSLLPDPSCDLQLRPFALNEQSAMAILLPRMKVGEIAWVDGRDPQQLKQIETLVSFGETFEQLARRIASLTGETFHLSPGSDNRWALSWGESLRALAPSEGGDVSTGIHLLSQALYPLEPGLQSLTIPRGYDAALRQASEFDHVFNSPRWLQWGESGAQAVHQQVPRSEEGHELSALRAHWYALTAIDSLHDAWRWRALRDQSEATDQGALPLGTIFLYDGSAAHSGVNGACELLAELLGGCETSFDTGAQGWCSFALAVPARDVPQDKALLERLIEQSRMRPIWQRLLQRMGCGFHELTPAPPPAWGMVPAIVTNNPGAVEHGAVSRSEDGMRYRTRIWVRLLGVDGDVEVDWAIPFASHDNSASGGSSGGDLILVPEEHSLGYVAFLGQCGAPLFLAMTHYRDSLVSPSIDPTRSRHGMVVDKGLRIEESSTQILIRAGDLLTLRALRARQQLGQDDRPADNVDKGGA